MRAFWSGEIAFGLVTIPAKLYTATKDLTPQFHQLHKECGTRVQLGAPLPQVPSRSRLGEIGKGYEVEKGEYALFTKEELAKLDGDETAGRSRSSSSSTRSRSTSPTSRRATGSGPAARTSRGYELLREVLEETKKVALAKVKLRTRTRLALLRPRGKIFSLDMMRFAEELVSRRRDRVAEASRSQPEREMQLALDLVDELSGPFDPAKHPDEYRSAVLAAVEEKVEAGQVAHDTTEGGEAAAPAPGASTGSQGDRPRRAPVTIDPGRQQARSCQGQGRGERRPKPKSPKAKAQAKKKRRDRLIPNGRDRHSSGRGSR
jgi:DNA end-binding protein Ku